MLSCKSPVAGVLALLWTALAQAAVPSPLDASLAAVEPKVIAWRRDLHAHPELSNREVRTAATVAGVLRQLGFDRVETGVAHTGVVGTLVGARPGPVIALRADMDALPVQERTGLPFASTATAQYNGEQVPVMHACGHDAHTAMLLGVAEVLAANREHLAGTVRFIFQPAEENPPAGEDGGAPLMIREGVLTGPDAPEAIFGLHVWPEDSGVIVYHAGGFMAASDDLAITVTGRQTHGSSPWLGVDPIYASARIITALQGMLGRQLDSTRGPAVISIGRIRGGLRGNIIPDQVELTGTIRTFDPGLRTALHNRLRDVVRDVAAANGATATVDISESAPVTSNDPALLQRMLPSLQRAAGIDRVREGLPITAAEDFGYYEQHIPGLYLLLGVGDPAVARADRPSNHSPLFDVQEEALIVGVRALVNLALDYARTSDAR